MTDGTTCMHSFVIPLHYFVSFKMQIHVHVGHRTQSFMCGKIEKRTGRTGDALPPSLDP